MFLKSPSFKRGKCCNILSSAAQFVAFFAKTKDGRARNSSRKMRCEKFAIKGPKTAEIWPKIDLEKALFSKKLFFNFNYLGFYVPICH